MNLITIMEELINKYHRENWDLFLSVQKDLVEKQFDWMELMIDRKNKQLIGKGDLTIASRKFPIILSYSPFNMNRYDRIFISDGEIKYHRDIHVYGDLSLCLYHPQIDQGPFRKIPLVKMMPWISEWIVFYLQWKKYGVWLGKEIKH